MPGFSFSPSIRNHRVTLLLKSGAKLSGKVVHVDPTQVNIQLKDEDERVVIVNRDEVTAYTGEDDRERHPISPTLVVSRCCNPVMRCNGVRVLATEEVKPVSCPLRNEHCESYSGDFFGMTPASQQKLLNGITIGEYPRRKEDDSKPIDSKQFDKLSRDVRQAQEGTRFAPRGTRPLGGRATGGYGSII